MNPALQTLLGLALLVAGAVLALGFPEQELGWFRGRPLGLVLAAVGVLDLAEAQWRRR
ncbi:hypothetical protein [Nocardioides dongxiaopingii]|uniref:hypothetical protein n=1 Tax=Nocardioides dongxiaopingii TaxID=2576036 RepID=UPI001485A34D|nr:hypothetical protein [Nocardioides dongxiaopingii]